MVWRGWFNKEQFDVKVLGYEGMRVQWNDVLWYVGMLVMYLKLWVCVVGWGMEVGMGGMWSRAG